MEFQNEIVVFEVNMNRGRLQAQGGKIEDSEAWNQSSPLYIIEAVNKLDLLKSRQSGKEEKLRVNAYIKAEAYINNCKNSNGVSARVSKTFMVKNDAHRRVDIEVIAGVAFQ